MKSDLRRLLWFDCTAAGVAGAAMLALGGLLAPLLGLPRVLLVFTALVNLAYGAYSFSLARQPAAPRGRVKALVIANFSWVAVCALLALRFANPASWLGAAFLLGEGIFVGVLAAVEGRALGKA
jgi:hypothetical protein